MGKGMKQVIVQNPAQEGQDINRVSQEHGREPRHRPGRVHNPKLFVTNLISVSVHLLFSRLPTDRNELTLVCGEYGGSSKCPAFG